MKRLPARERDMLTLQVAGNTLAEISDAFDCSESRTSELIARARLRLEERTAA
jgi:DNA-directed RNA polymerase specialized sigma24 family protein